MPTPAAKKPQCQPTSSPSEPQMSGAEVRTDIDADIEDRIGAVDALIAGLVEIADLRGDVRLEEAIADDEQQQAEEKQLRPTSA